MLTAKDKLINSEIEFNRMQSLLRDEFWDSVSSLIRYYGLIIDEATGPDVWKVTQNGSNQVDIAAGKAIIQDANGKPVVIKIDTLLTKNIPTTNATYKILVRNQVHNFEKGTVSVTSGSKLVDGSGTEFTKILGPNRHLIIDGAAYPIELVVDDDTLQLYNNFTGNTDAGLKFSVGGWFNTIPSLVADRLIYEHNGTEIVITTAAKGTYDYWLAQVVVSGGVITSVTDKRSDNIFTLHRSYAYTIVEGRTWTIPGTINLPSGDTDFIVPFRIKVPANQTVKIISVTHKINSGDAVTVKLQKNGSDITGFTGISVSTSWTETDPTDVIIANNDIIALIVTAVGATPAKNLSFTINLEITVQ